MLEPDADEAEALMKKLLLQSVNSLRLIYFSACAMFINSSHTGGHRFLLSFYLMSLYYRDYRMAGLTLTTKFPLPQLSQDQVQMFSYFISHQ